MKLGPRGRVTLLLIGALVTAAILTFLSMSRLPLRMPEDFTVQWRSGGGESPVGSQAVISLDGSHWTFYEGGGEEATEFVFFTNEEELHELYRLIRRNAVDKLKEETGTLYDGDNAGISLLWSGQYVNVWGLRVIPNQQKRYQEVYDGLRAFLEQKVPEHPPLD